MDALHARLLEAADADSDDELERAGKYAYIGVEALPQHTRKVVFRLGALLYYDYKEQGGGQRKSGIMTACCNASGQRKRPTSQQREAAAALMEKWHKSVEGAASREILEAAGKRFAEGKERRRAEREERHGARFDPDAEHATGEHAGAAAGGKRKVDRKKEKAKRGAAAKRSGGGRGKGRGDDILASGAQLRNGFTAFIAASDGGLLPNVLEAPVVGAPPEGSAVIAVAPEANTARARRLSGSESSTSDATDDSGSTDEDEDDDLLLSCSDDEESETEEDDTGTDDSGSDVPECAVGEGGIASDASAPHPAADTASAATASVAPAHSAAATALPTAGAASVPHACMHVHKPAAQGGHPEDGDAARGSRSSAPRGYITPHIGLGYADPVPFVSSGHLHPAGEETADLAYSSRAADESLAVSEVIPAQAVGGSTGAGADSAAATSAPAAASGTPVKAPPAAETSGRGAPAAVTPAPAGAQAQRPGSSSHGKWSAGRPLGSGGKVPLPSSVVSSPYVDVQTHQLFVDSSLRGEWERHTTGIGSKLLARMGYSGGQLGSRDRTSTGSAAGAAGAGSPGLRSPPTPLRPIAEGTPAGAGDGAVTAGDLGRAAGDGSPALRVRKDGRVQVSATAPMPEPVSAEKRTGRAGIGAPML